MSCNFDYPQQTVFVSTVPSHDILATVNATYVFAIPEDAIAVSSTSNVAIIPLRLPDPNDQIGAKVEVVNASNDNVIVHVTYDAIGSARSIRYMVRFEETAVFYAGGQMGWTSPNNVRQGVRSSASICEIRIANASGTDLTDAFLLKILNVSSGDSAVLLTPVSANGAVGNFGYKGKIGSPKLWLASSTSAALHDDIILTFQRLGGSTFELAAVYTDVHEIQVGSRSPYNALVLLLSIVVDKHQPVNGNSLVTVDENPGIVSVLNLSGYSGILTHIQYDVKDPETKFELQSSAGGHIFGGSSTNTDSQVIFGMDASVVPAVNRGIVKFNAGSLAPVIPWAGEGNDARDGASDYPIYVWITDDEGNSTRLNATMDEFQSMAITGSPPNASAIHFGSKLQNMHVTIGATQQTVDFIRIVNATGMNLSEDAILQTILLVEIGQKLLNGDGAGPWSACSDTPATHYGPFEILSQGWSASITDVLITFSVPYYIGPLNVNAQLSDYRSKPGVRNSYSLLEFTVFQVVHPNGVRGNYLSMDNNFNNPLNVVTEPDTKYPLCKSLCTVNNQQPYAGRITDIQYDMNDAGTKFNLFVPKMQFLLYNGSWYIDSQQAEFPLIPSARATNTAAINYFGFGSAQNLDPSSLPVIVQFKLYIGGVASSMGPALRNGTYPIWVWLSDASTPGNPTRKMYAVMNQCDIFTTPATPQYPAYSCCGALNMSISLIATFSPIRFLAFSNLSSFNIGNARLLQIENNTTGKIAVFEPEDPAVNFGSYITDNYVAVYGPFTFSGRFDCTHIWTPGTTGPFDTFTLTYVPNGFKDTVTVNAVATTAQIEGDINFYAVYFKILVTEDQPVTGNYTPVPSLAVQSAGTGSVMNNTYFDGTLVSIQYDVTDPSTMFQITGSSLNSPPYEPRLIPANTPAPVTIFGFDGANQVFRGLVDFKCSKPYLSPLLPVTQSTGYPIFVWLNVGGVQLLKFNATMTTLSSSYITNAPPNASAVYRGGKISSMEITIHSQIIPPP